MSLSVVGQGLEDPSELDPAVPVDGGISLLLAVGAALGGRRLLALVVRRQRRLRVLPLLLLLASLLPLE